VFRFDLTKPEDFGLWLNVIGQPLYRYLDVHVHFALASSTVAA